MRLYTIEEAEALLPEVRELLEALQGLVAEVQARRAEHDEQSAPSNGHHPGNGSAGRELQVQAGIERILRRMEEWEIVVRDPLRGLVDFMSERDGRTVCLCFVLGEDRIGYWHEADAGFAGRQPL